MKLFIVSDNNHGLTLEGILLGFCNGQSVGYLFSQFIIIVIFGHAVSILVSYFHFKLQDRQFFSWCKFVVGTCSSIIGLVSFL